MHTRWLLGVFIYAYILELDRDFPRMADGSERIFMRFLRFLFYKNYYVKTYKREIRVFHILAFYISNFKHIEILSERSVTKENLGLLMLHLFRKL